MRRKSTCRPAFTMVELAIAAVVVAILTVAAWPNREADDQNRLDAAISRLEADIEYARNLSLTTPADPAVLKVDMDGDKYWISKLNDPDKKPIRNPVTRKDYVVQLGRAGDSSVRNVSIVANNFGAEQMLKFDAYGGINTDGNVGLEFRSGERIGSLRITAGSAGTRQDNAELSSDNTLTNIVRRTLNGLEDGLGALGGGGR